VNRRFFAPIRNSKVSKKGSILKNRQIVTAVFGAIAPAILLFAADVIVGDNELFMLINRNAVNPVLDFACVYLSPVLFSVFYITVLLGLFFSMNGTSTATGILSIVNGVLSYAAGSLIKLLVMKPRPEIAVASRTIGLWNTGTFSFPSTLTMLAFGLSLPILMDKRRAGIILVALSYFMGFSVIYTGYHFPVDVGNPAILFRKTMVLSHSIYIGDHNKNEIIL